MYENVNSTGSMFFNICNRYKDVLFLNLPFSILLTLQPEEKLSSIRVGLKCTFFGSCQEKIKGPPGALIHIEIRLLRPFWGHLG